MNRIGSYEEYCEAKGFVAPSGLTELLSSDVASTLKSLWYRPDVSSGEITSLSWAYDLLNDAAQKPPANYSFSG